MERFHVHPASKFSNPQSDMATQYDGHITVAVASTDTQYEVYGIIEVQINHKIAKIDKLLQSDALDAAVEPQSLLHIAKTSSTYISPYQGMTDFTLCDRHRFGRLTDITPSFLPFSVGLTVPTFQSAGSYCDICGNSRKHDDSTDIQ